MKKLALPLVLLLLLAPSALGQTVGASQIRTKTDGGLVADGANALAVGIYLGSTSPASPVAGQLWCDTTTSPCSLRTYNGTGWELTGGSGGVAGSGGFVILDDLSSFPSNPADGMVAFVRSLRESIVYDATSGKWFYVGQKDREAKPDYAMEITGSPLPAAYVTGVRSSGGSMTLGTHVCAVTAYNSTGGETMPVVTTGEIEILQDQQTIGLTFTATGTGWRGKKLYCSKANTDAPLFYIATFDDLTTTSYTMALADSQFGIGYAPDVDFSRPLPAGWVSHTPDVATGGCGATATGILCHDRMPKNVGVGVSGPRAAYHMGTSPPDNWTAQWTVTYSSSGLNGGYNDFVQGGKVHAAVFADATLASTAAVGITQLSSDKPSPSNPLRFGYAWRANGGAWTASYDYNFGFPVPVVSPNTHNWLVRVTRTRNPVVGDHHYFSWSSDNGRSWAGTTTLNASTACQTIPHCVSLPMSAVGITVENAAPGSSPKATEITDFTWRAD